MDDLWTKELIVQKPHHQSLIITPHMSHGFALICWGWTIRSAFDEY